MMVDQPNDQPTIDPVVADNAMLLTVLREIDMSSVELPEELQRTIDMVRDSEHPGRMWMANYLNLHDVAQQVVKAARALPRGVVSDSAVYVLPKHRYDALVAALGFRTDRAEDNDAD